MSKKIEPITIIIPTLNNVKMLTECLSSMGATRLSYPMEILVVNNGHPASLDNIGHESFFRVIQTGGQNLGWEGGLIEGLKQSSSEFVMFANDDLVVPTGQFLWLRRMVEMFSNQEVAGVGPQSNFVMGAQHMNFTTPYETISVPYLIGFCVLYRRKYLDEVGGIDPTLPGGDDLDLSIRLRSKGYQLLCNRNVFVFHYGSVTGVQQHGGVERIGGWNSPQMTEKTNLAIIKKHGFRKWFECIAGFSYPQRQKGDDHEGDVVRNHIVGEKIADLGCANNKTVPHAVGVDCIPKGQEIPFMCAVSGADLTADVEIKLPFPDESQDTIIARHLLEHCLHPVDTITEWKRALKHDGRLIIAVPNEEIMKTIPMNGEHVAAYTPRSLKSFMELLGLKLLHIEGTRGGSVVGVFSKNGTNGVAH